MKFASSRRRRYEELRRVPDGLFVCGDAIASFNPTFGQGITVAALQAERLGRMGPGVAAPGANRRFLRAASEIVDIAWNTAAGRSFTFEGVQGRPTLAMRISNAYLPHVIARAHSDVTVATALLRVIHFLAPPSSLFARRFWRRSCSRGPETCQAWNPCRYRRSATPRTRAGTLAYQEFGSGPALLIVPPLAQHIEMMWEQPAFWRPLQRLASGFRVVLFDKLGTGLSDPVRERATLEQRVDELQHGARRRGDRAILVARVV